MELVRRLLMIGVACCSLCGQALIFDGFNDFPDEQGWNISTNSFTSFVFSIEERILRQNSCGQGDVYALFYLPRGTMIEPDLYWTCTVRARVTQYEEFADAPAGFGFWIVQNDYLYRVLLTPDKIRLADGADDYTIDLYDNTEYHTYQLKGGPDNQWHFLVDFTEICSGEPVPTSSFPYPIYYDLAFGDGTSSYNCDGDWYSYSFEQYQVITSGTPEYPHLVSLNSSALKQSVGSSMGSAWNDLNEDGDADLFVATDNGEPDFFLRNIRHDLERMEITPITAAFNSSTGGAWGDIDNDGLADLFVSELGSLGTLYHQISPGMYVKDNFPDGSGNSFHSSWADYDDDGYLDLFVAVRGGENRLYRNRGDGTFEWITTGPVVTGIGQNMMGAWCDYDLDGDEDLFVTRTGGENNLLCMNQGDGTFMQITEGAIVNDGGESWSASWGDYNNDGWPDLYVANNGEANFLYRNNQDGTFTKITTGDLVTETHHSRSSGWMDIDNDGDLDLYVSNKEEENRLYMNMGGGVFHRYVTGISNARGASFSDYDLDGDMDLFICNDGEADQLWRNANSYINHWLQVKCVGKESNRMGIGARVKMKATIRGRSQWQTREIVNHTGFGGGSEMIAHFGLKEATIVDSLRIEWPSGMVWDTTAIVSDTRLIIGERSTVTKINHAPVAMNDTCNVPMGSSVAIELFINDSDPDGDALYLEDIFTFSTVEPSIFGHRVSGILLYIPPPDYSGEDSFFYIISDSKGGLDTAQVTIHVMALNGPPVAENDTISVQENMTSLLNVLSNDSDPGGDLLQIASIDTSETMGSVMLNWDEITMTYIPVPDFSGDDSLTYVASDGEGGLDTAFVLIHVLAVNHPPLAADDTLTTRQDSVITIHVLENDTDREEDPLIITTILLPPVSEWSVAIGEGDTTLTFSPNSGFSGVTAFEYVISDGNGCQDTASVVITVEPVTSVEKVTMIPERYELYQNHPNPFNPVTEIRYDLPKEGEVRLVVFDVTGKRIASVVDQKQSAGSYRVMWNACDSNGHPVPSGVYVYRIEMGQFEKVKRMILVR